VHGGGVLHEVNAVDALGRSRRCRFALLEDGRAAFVEMAEACGLAHLREGEREPLRASSFGVGLLIRAAVEAGAKIVFVGAGGSATVDGGAGALAALGAAFLDARGRVVAPNPLGVADAVLVDTSRLDARLAGVKLVVLSDVRVCLEQNVRFFGPQKGVTESDIPIIERAIAIMQSLAEGRGRPFSTTPWLGAGGGLPAGLHAFAGADVRPGADALLDLTRFDERLGGATLVITGEGTYDDGTREGKLPHAIARRAAARGIPVAIVAGRVVPGASTPETEAAVFGIAPGPCAPEYLVGTARDRIADCVEQIVRLHCASLRRAKTRGPTNVTLGQR
jgi:glycerate kinase